MTFTATKDKIDYSNDYADYSNYDLTLILLINQYHTQENQEKSLSNDFIQKVEICPDHDTVFIFGIYPAETKHRNKNEEVNRCENEEKLKTDGSSDSNCKEKTKDAPESKGANSNEICCF